MKKAILIFILCVATLVSAIPPRNVYPENIKIRLVEVEPTIVNAGDADGQMLYWDGTNSYWAPSDEAKLKWFSATDILLADTLNLNNALTVPYGGTGGTTLTDGGILLGSGAGAITALGAASNGQVPIGDGTTDPVLATITGGYAVDVTNAAGSITVDVNYTDINANETDPCYSLLGVPYTGAAADIFLGNHSLYCQYIKASSTIVPAIWGENTYGTGVFGTATTGTGVFGTATTGYAGYFAGKAKVTSTLVVDTLIIEAGSITDTNDNIDYNDTDWQGIGSHVAGDYTSVVATGTAPFFCDSTTVCVNLNADLWDGYQFADYLNQDVTTTGTPTFATVDAGSSCEANAYTVGGVSGVSGTLELDDGTTEKITLVFTSGILTSRTVAATTSSVLADWTDQMKYIIIILLFCSITFGLNWNLNSDCWVNFEDFAIFSDGWQTTYDINDLADFSDEWLRYEYYCNEQAPVAANSVVNVSQYEPVYITFSAYDQDGFLPVPPKHLKYRITTLPSDGNAYIQNTLENTSNRFTEVPDWCTGWANKVIFASDTVGNDTVKFRSYDGEEFSNEATVDVNVIAAYADYVSFDGGEVTIPDNDYLDINDSGWAMSIWYRNMTSSSNGSIIKKRDSSQGWDFIVQSGKLLFNLYDANGLVVALESNLCISYGIWWEILIGVNEDPCDANNQYISMQYYQTETNSGEYANSNVFVSSVYTNDCNVIINPNTEIDHLRFWDDVSEESHATTVLFPTNSRWNYTESTLGIGNPSKVRFKMDEGSGSTITDDKASGLVGTFSGDVSWIPLFWDWNKNGLQKIEN